jgi:hypothetical protein
MMEKIMTDFEKVLIYRDGYSIETAIEELQDCRCRVLAGEDPEEILRESYGLEPDYFFDLLQ